MATLPQFQLEDQTDEDFFDKLVDDEFGVAGSGSEAGNVARAFSNMSIGGAGDSLADSKYAELAASEEDGRENGVEQLFVARKEEPLSAERSASFVSSDSFGSGEGGGSVGPEVKKREMGSMLPLPVANNLVSPGSSEEETTTGVGSPGSSVGKSSGSKGTSVKTVQWSAFNVVDPQQFDTRGFGSDADIFAGNVDGGKLSFSEDSASDPSTYLGSAERQDAQYNGSAAHQGTDMSDAQYWESLYPGWKYDPSTGQWYQIDGFDAATTSGQSDNYNAATANAQDSYHGKVSGAGDGFVFDQRSEISYSQHTAKSIVGTVAAASSTGNVSHWTQVPQESSEYPPNMVFDPQYPGWYYDTNTQQWYTLESYTHAVKKAGSALQDNPSQEVKAADGFNATENSSLYDDVRQFGQNTIQGQGNQDAGVRWNGFLNSSTKENLLQNEACHFQQNAVRGQGNQEMGAHWDGFTNSHTKQNMWQKDVGQFGQNTIQGHVSRGTGVQWDSSRNNYAKQNMWKPHPVNNSIVDFSGNQPIGGFHDSAGHAVNHIDHQAGFKNTGSSSNHDYVKSNGVTGFQSFVPAESMYFSQPKVDKSLQPHPSHSYYGSQSSIEYSQKPTEGNNASYSQISHDPNEGRSSAGRPPHALVTFGFGGKLIVIKDASSFGSKPDFGSQDVVVGAVSILSLTEVVMDKTDASSTVTGGCGYFYALSQQPFPGPLVGGSASTKDVNKYIDEKITQCQSLMMDAREGEPLMLLLSLLKISCQHYGKLRSPFGADPSVEKIDGPEAAVANLFSSASKDDTRLRDYGSFSHFLQNLPSEEQTQATAVEVQNLLITGRRIEALQCAQAGQLWGPALVLAAQLGEKFYVDTVKQMALFQLLPGSPLRTLCLLIAGQPAYVFSAESSGNRTFSSAIDAPQQPTKTLANGMLDDWKENLAIITANRTKDDELVIVHLGDSLWKERGQITAAHTCYLIAEATFESYSDSARMCLLGADHWKCPRTYASPEAIQRTELYEYSKVLGNSQFVLLPFQPYKLIYAYMLAEVGKVSDSLKYCQASLKLLKNSSRAPEVETWKSLLSSLEGRLRTHQQGGYSTNLDPGKLVSKLISSIDNSIHRMIGGPQSSLPPMPQSSVNDKETNSAAPKVSGSQSTMAMSSLIPSASVEGISEWAVDSSRKTMHSRSVSEPDFGRSLKQDQPDSQDKSSPSGGPSRLGRIGSQLLQKTVGWVSRSRSDRQAKLGEKNKFYFDEKLKRWVEEGTQPPIEEAALPPPPMTASFQNGMSDYTISSAFKSPTITAKGEAETKSPSPSEQSSGIPPMAPSMNQFSARGSMGVRSRYVDTFNKGRVAPTTLFQSPSAPSVKPPVGAKFFIPATPAPSSHQAVDAAGESIHEAASAAGEASSSSLLQQPVPPSIQRFPSMDSMGPVRKKGQGAMLQNNSSPFSSHSRAASWSGSITDTFTSKTTDAKPSSVDGPGVPLPFIPNSHSALPLSSSYMQFKGRNLGNDLHEVQL